MDIEELSLIGIAALIAVVAVAMLASRINVAAPLILVVLGIGIGYIPGVPLISIDPEIILLGVLPPLLYAAAVNVPVLDLRRDLGPISALSVVLVIISAIAIGALLHLVVPAIPFAAAVALGAVVAPTDAVAATSIGKRVGMPPRLVTILEGESLVNDATSLVLLRTAIAAVAGGFVFWEAAATFAFAVVVAIIIGLLVGAITVWVRSKLSNPIHDTVVSFTVPFIAFVPTEYLGASGVLAVVVTGLYSGHHAPHKFSATARVNERLNWRTAQFLLENGVFLLMGLELHKLVDDVARSDVHLSRTLLLALGVVVVLILLRMAFMWPVTWALARALPRAEARAAGMRRLAKRVEAHPRSSAPTDTQAMRLRRFDRMVRRTAADAAHARDQGLDWRGATILGWSGMRGVVTLAAAQSIPTSVPYRSQLVLIAFLVAVATLLLHGLTLPGMIRKLRPSGPSAGDRSQELTALASDLAEAGESALDAAIEHDRELAEADPAHPVPSETVIDRARSNVRGSVASMAFALPQSPDAERTPAEDEARAQLRLARIVLDAQRATLLEERAVGQYSSEALRAAEAALDAHELRLTPPSKH
ncbi:cation:proton antiporter [Leucobacter weissii]|uniref:Cation:proton antiporter n=1 Tax=Leucobacter weissii TaxID=1983706 RepID=A0A939S9F6_9MICO|nr:sodium:proton antiporter [Leucobacter weissii]MBO1900882.1 cation:proton antiporter [Leucobacter weissii]